MATNGKKQPTRRQFVSASSQKKPGAAKKPASQSSAKKPAAQSARRPAAKPNGTTAIVSAENRKKANGLRIGAVVLWVLAIAFEVLTILVINGTLYIPEIPNFFLGNKMAYIIIGIVLDLICVVIGSQLWKKSNRLDPCSEKNKLKFFLWNQMGVIAAVLAFFPLVLLLLKEDDLDPKTKKILSIIAAVVMLLSVGTSIDYNPVSAEDLAAAQSDAYELSADGNTAYFTTFGKCYHFNPDCHTIINSNPVYQGTIEEAFEANRTKACSYCAIEDGEEVFEKVNDLPAISESDVLPAISGSDEAAEVFYCLGQGNTCENTVAEESDLYCDTCDPDGDNVEG